MKSAIPFSDDSLNLAVRGFLEHWDLKELVHFESLHKTVSLRDLTQRAYKERTGRDFN